MRSDGRPSDVARRSAGRPAILAACGIGLGLATLALVARKRNGNVGAPPARAAPLAGETGSGRPRTGSQSRAVAASRGLNRACAVLSASVLLDSGMEHYRAAFFDPFMYAPLVASGLSLAASLHGTADDGPALHRLRLAALGSAGLVGLAGGGFHAWNVAKRDGGFVLQNLFYAAPLGAPYALILAGLLGAAAERVREADPDEPRLLGMEADRLLAATVGLGLLGTVGEAGLLHFRGAFQNPAMIIPVSLPPVGAALLLKAAVEPRRPGASFRLTRFWLGATSVMGVAGVFFHAYGVARMMGGWRNWRQNAFDGPPLPAPPSFTGLALAGIAALRLMEKPGVE